MVITSNNTHFMSRLFYLTFALLMSAFIFSGSAFAAKSGEWVNQETKVKGTWSIEERADGNYLVISDDFKTRNAPDLKFFLSKNNFQSINGSNATQDAVLISPLSKNKGSQEYKIPSSIDVSDYSSLIIHCQQFSKLWASTPIH